MNLGSREMPEDTELKQDVKDGKKSQGKMLISINELIHITSLSYRQSFHN